MIKGEKWVMGGKELWHLYFFLEKKALLLSQLINLLTAVLLLIVLPRLHTGNSCSLHTHNVKLLIKIILKLLFQVFL
jgi:hypothetical protein